MPFSMMLNAHNLRRPDTSSAADPFPATPTRRLVRMLTTDFLDVNIARLLSAMPHANPADASHWRTAYRTHGVITTYAEQVGVSFARIAAWMGREFIRRTPEASVAAPAIRDRAALQTCWMLLVTDTLPRRVFLSADDDEAQTFDLPADHPAVARPDGTPVPPDVLAAAARELVELNEAIIRPQLANGMLFRDWLARRIADEAPAVVALADNGTAWTSVRTTDGRPVAIRAGGLPPLPVPPVPSADDAAAENALLSRRQFFRRAVAPGGIYDGETMALADVWHDLVESIEHDGCAVPTAMRGYVSLMFSRFASAFDRTVSDWHTPRYTAREVALLLDWLDAADLRATTVALNSLARGNVTITLNADGLVTIDELPADDESAAEDVAAAAMLPASAVTYSTTPAWPADTPPAPAAARPATNMECAALPLTCAYCSRILPLAARSHPFATVFAAHTEENATGEDVVRTFCSAACRHHFAPWCDFGHHHIANGMLARPVRDLATPGVGSPQERAPICCGACWNADVQQVRTAALSPTYYGHRPESRRLCASCGAADDPSAMFVMPYRVSGIVLRDDRRYWIRTRSIGQQRLCVSAGPLAQDLLPEPGTSAYMETPRVCRPCWEAHMATCWSCGVERPQMTIPPISVNGESRTYCEDCRRRYLRWCDDHDQYAPIEEGCDRCEDEGNAAALVIRSHSWRPREVRYFRTEKEDARRQRALSNAGGDQSVLPPELFFGVELEIELNGCGERPAMEAAAGPECYFKSDGSLDDGFEIVTYPFTRAWFVEHRDELGARWRKLAALGCRSYETTTCGLHVHMSKAAFGHYHLYKFLRFIYGNWEFSALISQRDTDSMRSYCSLTGESLHGQSKAANTNAARKARQRHDNVSVGRYVAVNLENERTVEIRMFKGTLNPASFAKALDFCDAAFHFTKEVEPAALTVQAFARFVDRERKAYPHLHAFMAKRGVGFRKDAPTAPGAARPKTTKTGSTVQVPEAATLTAMAVATTPLPLQPDTVLVDLPNGSVSPLY